ncbi:transglutaminase-like putative cysteine protease [Mucilaginibacter oryzae]|uniref:Transglutaminase-like putative cysteine protease n=1 Tax=Mucilaginibacter oryzae TaxID=468058 RepID=A0A316H4J5_9SPHI|nr:transglutaminase family protein [Mucilaginibacter oryzae]PWK75999.1 transglutaminase-like putative cysteine protease [Mucilaginibacter oryzae]
MKYQVTHITRYEYQQRASLCHNLVYQVPVDHTFQEVKKINYQIQPEPRLLAMREDFFGNKFIYFSIEEFHRKLSVEIKSNVEIAEPAWIKADPKATMPWENVVIWLRSAEADNDIRQFYLESAHIRFVDEIRDYTLQSFMPGRPVMEAMLDLNSRIFSDFDFTPGFTDISTRVEDVFLHKKGVCQDFAHFSLACLRSVGLAARYVSGYIETIPPPGKPKLFGADASHAWIALYIPDLGWTEFDATNNLLVNDRHVRTAFGRDFADVTPLKGIVYSGAGQRMIVNVDVRRME